MRYFVISAVLAIFFLAASPMSAQSASTPTTPAATTDPCQGISAKHDEDRFTGVTEISASLSPGALERQPALYWTSKHPDTLLFEVVGTPPTWRYLNCLVLGMLADGQRVTITDVSHDGRVSSGFVVEELLGLISWTEAESKLSKTEKIEFKSCNDEAVAPGEFTCKVKDLVKQVASWKASQHPK